MEGCLAAWAEVKCSFLDVTALSGPSPEDLEDGAPHRHPDDVMTLSGPTPEDLEDEEHPIGILTKNEKQFMLDCVHGYEDCFAEFRGDEPDR